MHKFRVEENNVCFSTSFCWLPTQMFGTWRALQSCVNYSGFLLPTRHQLYSGFTEVNRWPAPGSSPFPVGQCCCHHLSFPFNDEFYYSPIDCPSQNTGNSRKIMNVCIRWARVPETEKWHESYCSFKQDVTFNVSAELLWAASTEVCCTFSLVIL